jgi:hypothetical protein
MGNKIHDQMEWDGCMRAYYPVNLMLPHKLQHKLEGNKEKRA